VPKKGAKEETTLKLVASEVRIGCQLYADLLLGSLFGTGVGGVLFCRFFS
jgi:hypothetical protein